jgi:hypothetical protein
MGSWARTVAVCGSEDGGDNGVAGHVCLSTTIRRHDLRYWRHRACQHLVRPIALCDGVTPHTS